MLINGQSHTVHGKNPAELNGVKYLKSHAQVLLDRTGAPDSMWFLAQDYLAHVHNLSANRQINWQIPHQVSRGGTPDISHILMFYWFEPVLYLDPVAKFPETTERPGYFVGFADNVGDVLTFKILKNDLSTVLHRSVVRSAADPGHLNKACHIQIRRSGDTGQARYKTKCFIP